ncbi:HD domain-containing phosphohydrolase [Deinococcus roseus]|uniref:3'3'-cGAMP-specific phosphodiesterase 3 n=1 Tax=Deinococcus roseus TaxID=392414 RepID=A0ABQ2D5X8_9DEIO|nr:HD domain-containing phosphohydrolase [Deinococcus roseus]GGJ44998.1 3'3'-cGAMP-specific phosphodiesterase 3 [Deinococcus roseus]
MMQPAEQGTHRMAEVMAVLSRATDLGMGQPLDFAMCSCVLSVRLGEALGLSAADLQAIYYQALMRYIGCNVDTQLLSAIVGDEMAFRSDFAHIDTIDTLALLQTLTRAVGRTHPERSGLALWSTVARGMLHLPAVRASFAGHCEVAQRLATRLGFAAPTIEALGQLYERWDGQGVPRGLKGEAISVAVQVVTMAQDMLIFHRLDGPEAAVRQAKARSGKAYAPRVVEVFCARADRLLSSVGPDLAWSEVLNLEPGPSITLTEKQFTEACTALADFVDIKSPFTLGHSSGIAALAVKAAQHLKWPVQDQHLIQRAALVHDLGRTGVSAGIWDKPGSLNEQEWEQVRLHPYHTERILSRSGLFAPLSRIAASHHERCDGSGYHKGMDLQDLPSQVLAAADVYHALTENRSHRKAFVAGQAAEMLEKLAKQGQLEKTSVAAILKAAGHQTALQGRTPLSDRELEVLKLLAQGHTTKKVALELGISPKTADHHIQHIYTKIGVSTRAGATLYAMEQRLLS